MSDIVVRWYREGISIASAARLECWLFHFILHYSKSRQHGRTLLLRNTSVAFTELLFTREVFWGMPHWFRKSSWTNLKRQRKIEVCLRRWWACWIQAYKSSSQKTYVRCMQIPLRASDSFVGSPKQWAEYILPFVLLLLLFDLLMRLPLHFPFLLALLPLLLHDAGEAQ